MAGLRDHFLPTAHLGIEDLRDFRPFGRRHITLANHPHQRLAERRQNVGGIDEPRNLHPIPGLDPLRTGLHPDTGTSIQQIEKAAGHDEGDHARRNLPMVEIRIRIEGDETVEGHPRRLKRIRRRGNENVDVLLPVAMDLQAGYLGAKIGNIQHHAAHPHFGVHHLLAG